MTEFGVIVNDKLIHLNSFIDVILTSFDIILLKSKYSSFEALKTNVELTAEMIKEFCDDYYSSLPKKRAEDLATRKRLSAEKSYITKMKKKIFNFAELCQNRRTRDELISLLYDFKMSMEGNGLLRGFQYTHKVHKDKVKNQPPDLTAGEFNRGE